MVGCKIVGDPLAGIVEYECVNCGASYSLEPDVGEIECSGCGEIIDCDVMSCLSDGLIDLEEF